MFSGLDLILDIAGKVVEKGLGPEVLLKKYIHIAIGHVHGNHPVVSLPPGRKKYAGNPRKKVRLIADKEKRRKRCPHMVVGKEERNMERVYKVVLDPGHGVETPGKRSPDGTYFEHEFNLDMAWRCRAVLERHGVQVTMTRTNEHDVSLASRVELANSIQGLDLFVSLHSNASGDGKSWTAPDGFGIYTSSGPPTAQRNIAARDILAQAVAAGIRLWGDGLFHDPALYVLRKTTAPAVLIECGFHTNQAETELLKSSDYRDKLTGVICKGILVYLGIPWKEEEAQPWYRAAQEWVMAAGISDGTRPEDWCTRAEVWQMLYRYHWDRSAI